MPNSWISLKEAQRHLNELLHNEGLQPQLIQPVLQKGIIETQTALLSSFHLLTVDYVIDPIDRKRVYIDNEDRWIDIEPKMMQFPDGFLNYKFGDYHYYMKKLGSKLSISYDCKRISTITNATLPVMFWKDAVIDVDSNFAYKDYPLRRIRQCADEISLLRQDISKYTSGSTLNTTKLRVGRPRSKYEKRIVDLAESYIKRYPNVKKSQVIDHVDSKLADLANAPSFSTIKRRVDDIFKVIGQNV